MIKIRLARHGKKNDPFYKIVAVDSHKKRDGKQIAILGTWHPREKSKEIDKKEIAQWVKKGAQISPTVKKLIS